MAEKAESAEAVATTSAAHAPKRVLFGTRKSPLALAQTNFVINALDAIHNGTAAGEKTLYDFAVRETETVGDKILNQPLAKIGDKGLFTKELEAQLLSGEVAMAVHSLKDVPTTMDSKLTIGCVLRREDPRDAVIMREDLQSKYRSIADLPAGSVIGTSSLRRKAVLKRKFPSLEFKDIRGNVQTRLSKLNTESNGYSATILAYAGLRRLGMQDVASYVLDAREYLYAVGQGALAVQCRVDDAETLDLLRPLIDPVTLLQTTTERAFLRTLEGGCHVPIGVFCSLSAVPVETGKDSPKCLQLYLHGAVLDEAGTQCVEDEVTHELSGIRFDESQKGTEEEVIAGLLSSRLDDVVAQVSEVGTALANVVIAQGAAAILKH